MTCPMPHRGEKNPPFPDFSKFGMKPQECGAVAEVSADGDSGTVFGAIWMTPEGRVGGLDIRGGGGGLDEYEQYQLEILIERCCQGNWALEGLKNITPEDSYAWALVIDAIVAGGEA